MPTRQPAFAALVTAALAPAQQPPTAAEIFAEVMKAQDTVERPTVQASADQLERLFAARRAQAVGAAARDALLEHRYRLRRGDALHFRGRLQVLAGRYPEAVQSFDAHLEQTATPTLRHRSLLFRADLAELYGGGPREALASYEGIEPEAIADDGMTIHYRERRTYMQQLRQRVELQGSKAPPLEAQWVIGDSHAPESGTDWGLESLDGKPALVLFFTPWLPPAQLMMFDVLEQADAHDDLTVVLVTHMTGAAWAFDEGKPHPGRGKLIRAEGDQPLSVELEVNYLAELAHRLELEGRPIVIEPMGRSRAAWHLSTHPTLFALNKDGRVVDHTTGYETHGTLAPSTRRIGELIRSALGANGDG